MNLLRSLAFSRISSLCPETKPLAEFLPRRFDPNGALLKRVRINQPDRPQSEWAVKRIVWSRPHPFLSRPVECVSEHGMTQEDNKGHPAGRVLVKVIPSTHGLVSGRTPAWIRRKSFRSPAPPMSWPILSKIFGVAHRQCST